MPTGQNDRAPPLSAHTCVPSECLEKALQAENSDLSPEEKTEGAPRSSLATAPQGV